MKKSNKIILGVAACAMACASVLAGSLMQAPIGEAKAEFVLQDIESSAHLTATVMDYTQEGVVVNPVEEKQNVTLVLPGENNTTENYPTKSFWWEDARYFHVTFDKNSMDGLGEYEEYDYEYSVVWTPSQVVDSAATFDSDHTYTAQILQGAVTPEQVNLLPTSFDFYLDGTQTAGAAYNAKSVIEHDHPGVFKQGWGLYIFSLTLNDKILYSNAFEIMPTDVSELEKPNLYVKKSSSTQGLNNSYDFSVDSSYKYVNADQIVWYVNGKAKDGRDFVLAKSDIVNETDHAIWGDTDAVVRTGATFHFDPPVEGNWIVTCKIFDEDKQTVLFTVPSDQVSTVKGLSTQAIIWIVVACAVAAAIIVAVVIVVSIRKEKVY